MWIGRLSTVLLGAHPSLLHFRQMRADQALRIRRCRAFFLFLWTFYAAFVMFPEDYALYVEGLLL